MISLRRALVISNNLCNAHLASSVAVIRFVIVYLLSTGPIDDDNMPALHASSDDGHYCRWRFSEANKSPIKWMLKSSMATTPSWSLSTYAMTFSSYYALRRLPHSLNSRCTCVCVSPWTLDSSIVFPCHYGTCSSFRGFAELYDCCYNTLYYCDYVFSVAKYLNASLIRWKRLSSVSCTSWSKSTKAKWAAGTFGKPSLMYRRVCSSIANNLYAVPSNTTTFPTRKRLESVSYGTVRRENVLPLANPLLARYS